METFVKKIVFEWINEADIIFSVGKAVESELVPYAGKYLS